MAAAEGQAMALLPRRAVADAPAKLEEEPRLADARLAHEEHDLAFPARARSKASRSRPSSRSRPTNGVSPRSDSTSRRVRVSCAPIASHAPTRLGLALEVDLAERARLEVPADQPVRGLGDRHAPRLADLLQPRGHVGGVAHRGVVHAQVAADATHHHEPGVEALPRRGT